jgi:hypothetical protein
MQQPDKRMPDLPRKRKKNGGASKKMLRQKANNQPRDQGGKFAKEQNFFSRLKMVVDGSARRKIAGQRAAETRRINREYEQGAAVIPRVKKARRSRRIRRPPVHQTVSTYRHGVIGYLIERLKFW